jgi:peptide chain release factor 1
MDPELIEAAKEEIAQNLERLPEVEERVLAEIAEDKELDERNLILEIRAGTGGTEAQIFAMDLFRMYQQYAEARQWTFEVISLSMGHDVGGGAREVIAEIKGEGAFGRLKHERGVHRVQRVPETENLGRVHTSTASVAVLPEAQEVDIKIPDKDLRIDVYRSGGAGGQHVNTTESAVRITHLPTGLTACIQDERSQHKNKAKAMSLIRARVYEMEQAKLTNARAAERSQQIGSAARSDKIRTYNFPQSRVTDHRIGVTLHDLEGMMEGDLDPLLDQLSTQTRLEGLLSRANAERKRAAASSSSSSK